MPKPKPLSRGHRAARLKAIDENPTYADAARWLRSKGYNDSGPVVREWAYRNGLQPQGGRRLTPATAMRLEAAERALDRIREAYLSLQPGEFVDLPAVLGDYLAEVGPIRGITA